MIGVTLSAEQVHAAPPEVRRWIEHEISVAFGSTVPVPPQAEDLTTRLVGCNPDEAAQMLELVQGILPVANVFFELGREAASAPVHGLRALTLADIARHARLSTPQQVVECLDVLTDALRRARGDAEALLYVLDDHGHCLIAEPTMRSVLHVWQGIVSRHALEPVAREVPITAAA